jgi:NADPH:quinone reductase-like Zn-dependent oxidoreductase
MSAPPTISGKDAAGEVVAVGSSVTNFAVGDRVFCMTDFRRNGTLAQYLAQDASLFAKIPGLPLFAPWHSLCVCTKRSGFCGRG